MSANQAAGFINQEYFLNQWFDYFDILDRDKHPGKEKIMANYLALH